MIGTSRLAYLQKIKDGVIFYEGFESDNFLVQQGWTTVLGSPTNSTLQAKVGIKSFLCTGTGATVSIIKKTIATYSNEVGVSAYPAAECWFYDDGTTTAGTGPYFKIKTDSGKYFQIGVRNSVSTTKYCINNSGNSAADNFVASAVNRAVGWHKFVVSLRLGSSTIMYVDGVGANVAIAPGANEKVTEVYVCSGISGDAGTFGYFDDVGLFYNGSIYILNGASVARACRGYNSAGTNVFAGNLPTEGGFSLTSALLTFPYAMRFEISQETLTNVECATPWIYVNPGDIYIYQLVDFPRRVRNYQPREDGLTERNQSTIGVSSTLFNGFKAKHAFAIQKLEGLDWKEKLNNYFDYCTQGPPFSMMIDSSHCGWGVLSAAVAPVASSVAIYGNISTNAVDNFEVGRKYRIFDGANSMRQKVTLLSKDTNASTLTFNENLTQDFIAGNYICDDSFLPFLELGQNTDGLIMKDERYLRMDWNQNCQDYTEP